MAVKSFKEFISEGMYDKMMEGGYDSKMMERMMEKMMELGKDAKAQELQKMLNKVDQSAMGEIYNMSKSMYSPADGNMNTYKP